MASKATYFVPQGYEEELRAAGLSFTPAIAETADRDGPPFRLPGVIITNAEARAKRALADLKFEDFIECRVGNQIYRLAVRHKESFALVNEQYSRSAEMQWTETYLTEAVLDFASWINQDVDFHIALPGEVVPPRTEGSILVVMSGRPPGEPAKTAIAKMCDVDLESAEYTAEYSLGIGHLVRDHETVIGQIVGKTFYIFLDISPGILPLVGIRGANIRLFERMLAVVWNAYLEGLPARSLPDSSPEELRDAVITSAVQLYEDANSILQAAEDALREVTLLYRKHLVEYQAAQAIVEGINAFPRLHEQYLGDVTEQHAAWERLRAHPCVKALGIVDEGINLITHPLVLTYEGRRHPLGSFTLRITTHGDLYVWCLDSPHPKRVVHPHVMNDGTMCFGNIALTMERLGTLERNFPKMFQLALELLTEGYDPTTTRHPLAEWPEEKAHA
jgi:hypothetical protein